MILASPPYVPGLPILYSVMINSWLRKPPLHLPLSPLLYILSRGLLFHLTFLYLAHTSPPRDVLILTIGLRHVLSNSQPCSVMAHGILLTPPLVNLSYSINGFSL